MRHPSARSDGRGDLTAARGEPCAGAAPTWLLVGNSRWHWAQGSLDQLRIRHREAGAAGSHPLCRNPQAWAAVGPLDGAWRPDPARQVRTQDVPLDGLPAWLGVDRALAGWLAWRQRGEAVLVADAGTVLSLTCINRSGRFTGGRLIAGLSLQLRAMAQGTAALPESGPAAGLADLLAAGPWPQDTLAAMAVGVSQALAAALATAALERARQEPGCRLVLSGGDAATLLPLIRAQLADRSIRVEPEPDLALRALVALRPDGGPSGIQASPRSAST